MTQASTSRRDFRAELREVKCWDAHTQALFEEHGEALEDCVLQNRDELIALCELVETLELRSWLEIGAWTGALTRCMQALFSPVLLAVCDDGWAEQRGLELRLPDRTKLFRGDSGSRAFARWRAQLGHVDLVFIDANHAHHAVARDFAINRHQPHRLLAFHDITGASRYTTGVHRFWTALDQGHKLELLRPHRELGLDHSVMGIGVWSEHPFPGSRPA
jgi:hypothetical protein